MSRESGISPGRRAVNMGAALSATITSIFLSFGLYLGIDRAKQENVVVNLANTPITRSLAKDVAFTSAALTALYAGINYVAADSMLNRRDE